MIEISKWAAPMLNILKENLSMEKIKASIRYGRILSAPLKAILWTAVAGTVLCYVLSIAICVLAGVGATEFAPEEIACIVALDVFLTVVSIICLYFFVREQKFKRSLRDWEKDFQKLYADVELKEDGGGFGKRYLLKAEFKYSGERRIIERQVGDMLIGYDRIFKSCLGKDVPIYYSPSFDEIVFIEE